MSFWDFFRKKEKENAAADSGAGFVPMTTPSDSDASDGDAASQGGSDAGSATSTDGGGASGGDGGGGV